MMKSLSRYQTILARFSWLTNKAVLLFFVGPFPSFYAIWCWQVDKLSITVKLHDTLSCIISVSWDNKIEYLCSIYYGIHPWCSFWVFSVFRSASSFFECRSKSTPDFYKLRSRSSFSDFFQCSVQSDLMKNYIPVVLLKGKKNNYFNPVCFFTEQFAKKISRSEEIYFVDSPFMWSWLPFPEVCSLPFMWG